MSIPGPGPAAGRLKALRFTWAGSGHQRAETVEIKLSAPGCEGR